MKILIYNLTLKTMKTKIALWILATTMIVALWINSVSAMYWQGRAMRHWKWMWQGHATQVNHKEDPSALITDVAKSDVSEVEKEFLINQYWEEKMARDLYAYAASKYSNVNSFSNISKSEQ